MYLNDQYILREVMWRNENHQGTSDGHLAANYAS